MTCLLAYAETTDTSNSGVIVGLVGLLVIGVVAALTLIPIASARYRRLRHRGAIPTLALLWGLISAGSIIYIIAAEFRWHKEWLVLVQSGYYDPRNTSGAPAWPWPLWIVLALAYAGLLTFCLVGKTMPPEAPPSAEG